MGTVARTAVIAGTASATANAVNHHSQQKAAQQEAAAQQQAAPPQQAPAAPPPPAPPPPPSAPTPDDTSNDDLVGRLTQLGKLRDAGVVSDDEFAAAKAKLLGG